MKERYTSNERSMLRGAAPAILVTLGVVLLLAFALLAFSAAAGQGAGPLLVFVVLGALVVALVAWGSLRRRAGARAGARTVPRDMGRGPVP